MHEYAVGIEYHDLDTFKLWQHGVVEDYESNTCIFITAESPEDAIKWAEHIACALIRHVNHDDTLDWKAAGHDCSLVEQFDKSGWYDVRGYFQHVRVGEMPDIERMTPDAFSQWHQQHQAKPSAP